MKHIVKASLILLVIGVLLTGVGGAAGGVREARARFSRDHAKVTALWTGLADAVFDWRDRDGPWDWDDVWDDGDWDSYHHSSDNFEYGSQPADFSSEIDALDLKLSEGDYRIRFTSDPRQQFTIRAAGVMFRYYATGMEKDDGGYVWEVELRGDPDTDTPIEIFLPEARTYRECELRLSYGSLRADSRVDAALMDLNVSVGEADLLSSGASQVNVRVKAGSVILGLDRAWKDYGYRAEYDLGSITVNDETLEGPGSNTSGAAQLNLRVSMGSLQLVTNENPGPAVAPAAGTPDVQAVPPADPVQPLPAHHPEGHE